MLLPDGTYASALSAETGGVEGATYTWAYDELTRMLSAAEIELAEERLGEIDGGVWQGDNILTRREGRENEAAAIDEVLATLLTRVPAATTRTRRQVDHIVERDGRKLPHGGRRGLLRRTDDASGKARVGRRSRAPRATTARSYTSSPTARWPMSDCSKTTPISTPLRSRHTRSLGEGRYLDTAGEMNDAALDLFVEGSTAYMTSDDTDLPVRQRERTDSPTPSGASTLARTVCGWRGDRRRDTQPSSPRRYWSSGSARLAQASLFAGTALESMLMLLVREE